jgi:histidinol phosphatase-like PHP family hydrolase
MWREAIARGHTMLAITDHIAQDDPRPLLDRLRKEARAFEEGPIVPLVGVELTMLAPRRIAGAAEAARRAGAQVVIVHGETLANRVPMGTNRAAVESGAVDVLAHPGFLTERDAELARAHGTALELTGSSFHMITNGHVAAVGLRVGADLVVDSDAHDTGQLLPYSLAESIARGAGLSVSEARRALYEAPARLLRRCRPS